MIVYYQSFLSQFKGIKGLINNKLSETEQLLIDMEIKDYNNSINYPDQYLIELSKVNNIQTITILNNQSIFHFIIKLDIFNKLKESSIFSFNNKYLVNIFYNIILDTGAAGVFIVKEP
jgi:hypothetical protein